jgi:hypothetical protein
MYRSNNPIIIIIIHYSKNCNINKNQEKCVILSAYFMLILIPERKKSDLLF